MNMDSFLRCAINKEKTQIRNECNHTNKRWHPDKEARIYLHNKVK
jgi:hypothetical protein